MIEDIQTDFQIVSRAFGSWNVKFRIEVAELLNQEALLRHLRRIKHGLAKRFTVEESHLVFDGILRKDRTKDFVDVVVRVTQKNFQSGNPTVHFEDGTAPDGTRFANMTALLDIFYLDQFNKPIMLDRVTKTVKKARIAEDLVDGEMIKRKLKEVLERKIPIQGIPIARGAFPSVGEDAQVEFYFQAVVEPENTDEYYSSRRVNKGDVLCRIQTASAGRKPGRNVLGEEIPPRKGVGIDLNAGSGCVLSIDGSEAVAEIDGVVVISRKMKTVKTLQGLKEFPEAINVKVNSVLRIDGNCVVDITSSKTVEVVGNLSMGSRILTDREVYISGNVEEGATIDAGDDVTVEGMVRSADVHSDASVIAQSDVTNSTIVARDQVIIKGTATNTFLQGDSVTANTVAGGKIVARKSATLARIEADENQVLSTICVGMSDYFQERIRGNEEFLIKARENLARIESVFGGEVMKEINERNFQTVLMRVLSRFHLGQDQTSRKQAEVYRKLLQSVTPTRALVDQKEQENRDLRSRLEARVAEDSSVVVITERMASRAAISVDGVEAEIPRADRPAEIRSDGKENLMVNFEPRDKKNKGTHGR